MKMQDIKTLISSGVIIIAVVLYLTFKPDNSVLDSLNSSTEQIQDNQVITLEEAEKATGEQAQSVDFVSANDGDTFKVKLNGQEQRVRLLMIDTPEMNYDKGEPMPYAEDAKQFTADLMAQAKDIQLLFDKGPKNDSYDRLLAYVFVDGVLLQEQLLQEGYAAVRYVDEPNNTLEDKLRDIQADAEKARLNIWSLDGYFENNRFNEDFKN